METTINKNKLDINARFYIRRAGDFLTLVDTNTQIAFNYITVNFKDEESVKTARMLIEGVCKFAIHEYVYYLIHVRSLKPNRDNRGNILSRDYEDSKQWQDTAWSYTTVQALKDLELPANIIPLDANKYEISYERELLELVKKESHEAMEKIAPNIAKLNDTQEATYKALEIESDAEGINTIDSDVKTNTRHITPPKKAQAGNKPPRRTIKPPKLKIK